ncbi:MAG: DUF47 domain-containing protein, partial [Pigmentiphaga sp.]|nr:DUF47 domain-containing protein [Pigmentiphaga sp.]
MPKEGRFFDLFTAHADLSRQGSRELAALMADLDQAEERVKSIETLEKKADKVTHDTIDLLH